MRKPKGARFNTRGRQSGQMARYREELQTRAATRCESHLDRYRARGVPERPAIQAGIRQIETQGFHHTDYGRACLDYLEARLAETEPRRAQKK